MAIRLTQSQAVSSGIFLTTGTTADIRNNVIVNNLGVSNVSALGSFCIYAQNSNSQFLNIDYNNYFSNPTGTGTKAIGMISSVVSATLNSWKTATGKDRSSLNYEAGFTSNTNLLPDVNNTNVWSLNGRGTQIPSVILDYSGNTRSTLLSSGAPDIGAYEFTPAALPPFAVQTGSIADGSTSYYLFGDDTVATITWHGSNLPSAVSARYFSGNNPPSAATGNFGNAYVSFTPTGGSNYTFDLTLYYDPALIGTISDENNISLANYTTGNWTHYDVSLNTPLRKVTKTGISQLSVFTIDDNESPMPVTLKYFNSSVSGRNVMLEWVTISEINNSGFEVERKSEFDSKWVKAGFVQGSGTVNEEKYYSFTDKELNTAKYSYRLKQIDYSGAVEYLNLNNSVIIGKPVEFGISQNYPNPSNPNAKIDFQIPQNSVVQLKIYDISGKEVGTIISGYLEAGYHTAEFDGTNLASGVYFYRISSENFSKTMKLILVK
jgi:hypothetical protein